MIKLLSSLLGVLNKLLGLWNEYRWKQQGRQETKDAVNEQVKQAEIAVAVPDPERTERLRNRFDRSRTK